MLAMVRTARTQTKTTNKRLAAITIGVTGAWDAQKSQLHASPNLPFLEGQNLLELAYQGFSQDLDLASVEIDNEVNYAALGEQTHGAAKAYDSFFYLNLGSGIGGAAVVNRQLHRGEHGFAGELGFLPIWNGNHYQSLEELSSRNTLTTQASLHGLGSDAMDLLEAARLGNPIALDLTKQLAQYLALGVCSIITTLNPNIIVIGGSIGRYSDILIPLITAFLPESLIPHCHLLGTALKGDAALLGAVAKALELARSSLITADLL
jgi:predicted NBD/HSP70 family sugar kinase